MNQQYVDKAIMRWKQYYRFHYYELENHSEKDEIKEIEKQRKWYAINSHQKKKSSI